MSYTAIWGNRSTGDPIQLPNRLQFTSMSQLPKTNIVRFSSWPWCAVPRLARSCRHCWRHSFSGSNQLGWRIETVQKYLQNNTGTEEYLLPFEVKTIYVWYELKGEHCTIHNIGQKPDKKAINVQKMPILNTDDKQMHKILKNFL